MSSWAINFIVASIIATLGGFGLSANKLLVIERLLLRKGGQRRQNRLITNSLEMIISQIEIQREAKIQTDCFKGKEIRGGKIQIQIQNKSQHERI